MPRYEVASVHPVLIAVTIEADSPEQACDLAAEIFAEDAKHETYEAAEVVDE